MWRAARRPGIPCLVALILSLAACSSVSRWPPESWADKKIGSFPYHPLVYHLDLSILAYQLHSQTLVWPFDPYYTEEVERGDFMEKVWAWVNRQVPGQAGGGTGIDAYRGPGPLGGFAPNQRLDPILYRYGGLHPWSNAVNFPSDQWVEMTTPGEITGQIREVWVCYRQTGGEENEVVLERIQPGRVDWEPGASDVLLAFEGGTGDKGEPRQPAAQSIMGFVLARTRPETAPAGNGNYDVHIAFRGSRSGGSVLGTVWDAYSTEDATGNPDWITDVAHDREVLPYISTTGEVHRGFGHSMRSILPTVFRCLDKVAELRGGRPESVYVTGHSLGGALAQHFVSAVLQGDRYGPDGNGPEMPAALQSWPWNQIKLITYGAPRTGDEAFARELTVSGLESEFFSTTIDPQDDDALRPADPSIVPRLIDPLRPAGYRVLMTRDTVTTAKIVGGKHVGKSVYINKPNTADLYTADPDAHQPPVMRQFLLDIFADERNPPSAWRYIDLMELNPLRNEMYKGSAEELRELAEAVERYYTKNGIWYDPVAFARALKLRFDIASSR